MKQYHIACLLLTLGRGGAERVVANLCNDYLVKQGKVTIITCMKKEVGYTLDSKITHRCIEETSDASYSSLADRFLKRRRLLKRVLKDVNPDVLLCFLPEPNFLALSLKKSFPFPMIISVRNDPVREYGNVVYKSIMKMLYPKADGYVFQTKEAMEYFSFSKHILEKGKVIPNPLGKEYIGEIPCEMEKREPYIVNVGKLDEQKNQEILIRAFCPIAKKYPGMILKIYGEGILRSKLIRITRELDIASQVVFCGNKKNLKEDIKNSSLFVLTSDYEGMPNALMEAMALGLPVISTDCPCGGPAFLIEHTKNGILVPVGAKEELTLAMDKMLQDKKMANEMGKNACEIQYTLHPDIINRIWGSYITKVMKERSK
ncbi:MAG: glycosyltransferase [Lachnospiraceae bacterium]